MDNSLGVNARLFALLVELNKQHQLSHNNSSSNSVSRQKNNLSINATPPSIKEKFRITEAPKEIPRRFHVIWLGKQELREEGIRNVYRALESGKSKTLGDYKLTIWTDSPQKALCSLYKAEYSDDPLLRNLALINNKKIEEGMLKVKHFSKLFSSKGNKDILDNNQKRYAYSLVLRNLHGAGKIIPVASDILRNFAEYGKGGVYFDIDVAIPEKIDEFPKTSNWYIPLYEDVNPLDSSNYMYLHYTNVMVSSVGSNYPKELLKYQIKKIHDFSKKQSKKMILELGLSDKKLDITWHAQRWSCRCIPYGFYNREYLTWRTTGPDALKDFIRENIGCSELPKKRLPKSLGYYHENKKKYSTDFPRTSSGHLSEEKAISKGIKMGVATKSKCYQISIFRPETLKGLNYEDTINLPTGI